jgi:hypothetical protein
MKIQPPTNPIRLTNIHNNKNIHSLTQDFEVIAPDLQVLAEGRTLPHVYEENPTRICLYMPGTGEWNPDKRIVGTIVPWAVLWLFYFEDWLITGEWSGGGEHPTVKDDVKKNSRDRRRRN